MKPMDTLGKPSPDVQSKQILTGRALYTGDMTRPNMLIGMLLYSPHSSARITRLDVSKAKEMPGVAAVITHEDIPGENSYLYFIPDQPLLAVDQINFMGDAVAAVAAESEEIAKAALAAIEVEYEPFEAICDPKEAMKPEARIIVEGFDNVIKHHHFEMGDIEAGFAAADVVIENTYNTQMIEQVHMETEAVLAYPDVDGMLVVYASTQAPHRDRSQIARTLAIPENRIRVIAPYIGGGFGAKDEAHVQMHAALLTVLTDRPVRIVHDRETSLWTHPKRHAVKIKYKSGATKDGKLVAIKVEGIGDTGPYANSGPFIMGFGASVSHGPYYVPNAVVDAYTVRTNNLLGGSMRGFGGPQFNLAHEAQMDALANELGIDPLEIRMRNAVKSGQMVPSGGLIREAGAVKASLEEAARISGWEKRGEIERQPEPHLRRGWGIGSTMFVIGLGRGKDNAAAIVEMAPDASVVLRTGATEMGQGVFSSMAYIAADTLGIDPKDVHVVGPDTMITPDSGAAVASRQTFTSGNAVLKGATVIRKSLLETGAEVTGLDIELLDLHKGQLYAEGEMLSVSIKELAEKAYWANRQMNATGYYAMEFPQELNTQAEDKDNYFGVGPTSFGTNIAQVLVDIETGMVTVERLIMAHNVGKVINYGGAIGQMTGAATMGAGYALMEELLLDNGILLNGSLESFLIPTALDAPEAEIKLIEIPEPYGPHGAVGLGEPSITPVAPAIRNAVLDAIGVPINRLPLTPERVLAAIEQGNNGVTNEPTG
jgi:nicotinate dehydrogenase large molybdopterin subunit